MTMTAREWPKAHPWVFWPALALAACLLGQIALWVHAGNASALADRHRAGLARMEHLADGYRALKAQAASRVLLAAPGTLSASVVTRIAREKGIADRISTSSIPPIRHDDDIVERAIDLSLLRVRREDLARFLHAVEAIDPAIRTKSLRITTGRKGSKDSGKPLVDAKVQFATYEMVSKKTN